MIFVICYLTFLLLAFLLRLAPLGRYVTPDEPAWVYRSIRFADALTTRNWEAIPSTGHPGVTTMWLGSLGVSIQRLLSPAESAAHLDWIGRMAWLAPENGEAFRHLAFFLPGGRITVALTTTLGLAALYPLLTRLLDRRLALLTIGLLAFDPFLIGHSGLLHTDALLATFSLLALTVALNGLIEPRRAIWWALSGLFTGLALLTKTPAIILLPFITLFQFISHFRKSPIGHWPLVIVNFALFISVTAAICFALYPALWANPVETFNTLFAFSGRHIEMAQRPIFFAGQMTYNPGPLFYPVVLLFRISPIVLVGLVAGLITQRRLPPERRLAFLTLLVFSISFGTLMGLGVKKHDRYLLPALPPLTLAAALGISTLVDRHTGRLMHFTKHLSINLPIYQSTIILQILIALAFSPHPLTYANPLAGGPWVARRVLDLNWGEAMGAAARWLNEQPDADQLVVAAGSVPTFASLFKGYTVPFAQASVASHIVSPLGNSDDAVIHTRPFALLDHVTIETNIAPTAQATYLANNTKPNDLILIDTDTPLLRQHAGPGTLVSLANLPTQAAVSEKLNELTDDRSDIWLVADPAASPFTAAYARQSIEAIATPIESELVGSATITRFTIRDTQIPDSKSQIATFGHKITLVDAQLHNDTHFIHTLLRWQVPDPTPTNLRFFLYLMDADGHLWADVGQLVLNDITFPSSNWEPSEWSDQSLRLKAPDRIPPGTYTIKLIVTDGTGAQLGAWDADGAFQGVRVVLGQVEIAPPAKAIGQASCLEGQELAAKPFVACIAESPPQAVHSGDAFAMTAMWSATTPPGADYRVRWRLARNDIVALEYIVPLSSYATSNWQQNDSFDALYDLRIDPTVPMGDYDLTLNVIDPDSNPLWAKDEVIGTVEVLHRDRQFDLPDNISHPLDLALGDTIHLRGFDLDATKSSPGNTLPLTLYWQGDGPTDIDYTAFVHLIGPDGLPHGQLDYFPGGGTAPTTSWAQGQVIIDEFALPITGDAAPGTYHIAVGLYDAASGGRLPVTDGSGQRLPNDQTILPIKIIVESVP